MSPESWLLFVIVAIAAFILQFFDASVGMGFGEITALLILIDFAPIDAIPSVIFASAVLSLLAGFMHHDYRNISLKPGTRDFKIAFVLTAFGALAIIIGALITINLPETILKLYIGALVLIIGLIILVNHARIWEFSWGKIIGLGSLAAFNKGISGGGYGPVLAGGQILSGVRSKKAVGITAISEGFISLVGVIAYFVLAHEFDLQLISALLAGGLLATPVAVILTKKARPVDLRKGVGIVSILLGALLIARAIV